MLKSIGTTSPKYRKPCEFYYIPMLSVTTTTKQVQRNRSLRTRDYAGMVHKIAIKMSEKASSWHYENNRNKERKDKVGIIQHRSRGYVLMK